ncbi:tail fiber protein [Aeromonas sp. Y311-2]|uniref:tail fiber protein n=1 Tax=Aeromonas sp. Y311-2 TaxID=2990507 RepID=UPI0022E02D82|nr:tail fiber protein [Aeromonas sp. Y311-2]
MSDQEITFSPPMSVDTSAFALLADLQYHEPFASEALNRKFYGIIPPGIYRGFQYVLPGGMTLRIGRPSEAGSAIIHVGDRCITVQQYKPVDLVVAAGFVGRVVLEGFYQLGVKTKQVDSASTIDAVSIKLVTEAQYKPDHVTLYNLNVPANATAMQASYIIDAKRDDVDIAVDSSVYRDLAEHIASPTAHTKAQVGLSNVNNWGATSAVNDASDVKYATASAVKKAYDLAASKLDSSANAVSATKLATPRQINGTNFDGTANITTANWGTARTLTIGNAAKSVNGGGNVAWSLTEIGALPIIGGNLTGTLGIKNVTGSRGSVITPEAENGSGIYWGNASQWSRIHAKEGVVQVYDGTTISRVYHQGFKPTASDVGLGNANNTADSAKNVLSATKLTTPRQINGTNFDGTGDITFSQLAGNSYVSGGLEKPNYFGAGKLRYQMLGAGTGGAAAGLGAYCDALWISSYTGNDVKRSNLLLMSKDSARIGFRQASYDATDWGPLYQIYHTGYKPTATDIGALPSSGGDMTGNIRSTATYRTTIDQTLGFVMQRPGKPNLVGIGQAGDGSAVVGYGAEAAVTAYLKIGPDTLQADIGSGIKKIYHEGFKPTATDVGALRSSSYGADLNNLDVSGQYLLRQEVTNKPVGASGIGDHIIHQQWDANAAYQIYTEFNDARKGGMWTRNKSGGKWGGWKQVYDTVNKPTAADVGAISKSGDTLPNGSTINDHTAGNLNIIGANNGFYGARNGAFLVNNAWYNGVAWAKFDNARPSGVICVRDGVPEFRYSAGGETDPVATQYRIYHSGFKPTADDVGALPITGGTITSNLAVNGNLNVKSSVLVNDRNVIGVDGNVTRFGDSEYARSMRLSAKGGEVYVLSDSATANRVYHQGFKPTAADVGALPISGGSAGYFRPTNAIGAGYGLAAGNGDGAGLTTNNIRIESWYGIGFWCTQGTPGYSHSFDTRNGHTRAKGDYYAQTDKRVYHEGFKPTASDVGLGNVPNMAHNIEAQVSTVPIRDGSGDIKARLFRSNYGNETGISASAGIAFRNSTSDDYVRFCSSPAAIRGWLGLSAVENKAWVRVASGACNLNLANGRDVYVGRFSTGVAFASRTFDQGRYRIVMKTTGSVSTGNANTVWWSVRGEILPVQTWSGTSLQVEVYCSGGDIQSGKVDAWELYEWK